MDRALIISAILLTSFMAIAQPKDSLGSEAKTKVLKDTTKMIIDHPVKTASADNVKIKKTSLKSLDKFSPKQNSADATRIENHQHSSAVFRRKSSNLSN